MLGVSVELGTNLSLSGSARLQPPLVRLIVIMRSVMAARWWLAGWGRGYTQAVDGCSDCGPCIQTQIEGKQCQHWTHQHRSSDGHKAPKLPSAESRLRPAEEICRQVCGGARPSGEPEPGPGITRHSPPIPRDTDTDPHLRHHHGCSRDGAGRPEDVLPVRGAAAAVQRDPAHQLHHSVDPLQHTVQPGEWQGCASQFFILISKICQRFEGIWILHII